VSSFGLSPPPAAAKLRRACWLPHRRNVVAKSVGSLSGLRFRDGFAARRPLQSGADRAHCRHQRIGTGASVQAAPRGADAARTCWCRPHEQLQAAQINWSALQRRLELKERGIEYGRTAVRVRDRHLPASVDRHPSDALPQP
jgi:hypothetical protein